MGDRNALLIALLTGALGWLITHVVDRVSNAPTVEYSYAVEHSHGRPVLVLNVANITRGHAFQEIEILLTASEQQTIDAVVHPVEPASEGNDAPLANGRTVTIWLRNVLPGSVFEIRADYSGGDRPTIRATTPNGAMRFQKANWETLIVKNELLLLTTLIFVLAVIVGFALSRSTSESGKSHDVGSPE